METNQAVACLEALSNVTRLNIYRYLVQAGHSGIPVGEIQKELDIPASTLSHHLARLMRANLVSQERQSRTLMCHANYSLMEQLVGFLGENCCVGDKKNC